MQRAAQYDENLARDIKDYVHGRQYGLVYEASKPEFVRMWKKAVVRGDIVNILPPRGVMEESKSDDDPSEIVYRVIAISEGVATLRNEQTDKIVTASVDDIVALARFDKPIYAGLKENGRIERGGDKPYHVVINGENYHALQTLVYAYQGQVDCIYIDPPYNTGATDWKYNNNYVGKDDKYRHSKWLTFMEDRLKLAKKLLNPKNSVLIVTIDEKEYLRLGLLLEQLFREARIQMISSVINPSGSARKNIFSRAEEYIYFIFIGEACVYPNSTDMIHLPKEDIQVRWASLLRSGSNSSRSARPKLFYPVFFNSETGKYVGAGASLPLNQDKNETAIPDGCFAVWPTKANGEEARWTLSQDTLAEKIERGFVKFGSWKKGDKSRTISYLSKGMEQALANGELEVLGKDEDGTLITGRSFKPVVPLTVWNQPSHGAGDYGSSLLLDIFISKRFTFPKSLYAVSDTLRFVVKEKKDALIVDFFSGSGTTLHAVNLLNAEDGGNRRCIMVTNNEVSDDEAKLLTNKGYRPGDDEWEKIGIAQYVTWPRTLCSIEGRDVNGNPLKGNYIGIDLPMADGFKENAIFFDLEYLEPSVVDADLAFENIAPILWICGGCKGEILHRHKGYVIGETYAVLFDPRYKRRFVDAVTGRKKIKMVFIVTDVAERYRTLCAELPGCRVMQLYESYLRSFEVNAIG